MSIFGGYLATCTSWLIVHNNGVPTIVVGLMGACLSEIWPRLRLETYHSVVHGPKANYICTHAFPLPSCLLDDVASMWLLGLC
jgi:hypothetical protein